MHYISAFFHNFKYVLFGAGAVSLAEYLFHYNLIDLIVEKVSGLFSKSNTPPTNLNVKK